ncbi:hypothetical protein MED134_15751 [Dokdonia sp. MED134]|uniref:hypothetical protein n=1 Tax=Dokdonia sp. MED134 TaxID=313590 RepID=UPI0000689BCE|nr:hypothetical protein [Dokdonia sp. MED134]AIN49920.1 hypothetical protein MED134_15751 [Dokdonia sp. MED134]
MKEHQQTAVFCIVSLIGNLLPLLLGLLFYVANSNAWEGWNIFFTDGQFYLYSASLLTASAYIFYTYKVRNTDLNSVLLLVSGLLILVVSLFYAWKLSNTNNNIGFVKSSSGILFIVTLVLYYYSNLLSHRKIDVIASQKQGVEDILKQL